MPENALPVVYTHAKCSTCRNAVKWLQAHKVQFVEKPIRETPPSPAELRRMLAFQDGNLRRLFNTSGIDYRAQRLSERLPSLGTDEAIALLSGNGSLVKRPFVLGRSYGLVGFDEAAWEKALG